MSSPSPTLSLPNQRPVHFIGVGGIGMSALAGILADRGFDVSGSDPKEGPISQGLRGRGVRIFREQTAGTIDAIRSGVSLAPLVVVSTAVPETNPELQAARRAGLEIRHRSELLAWLIEGQRSIAVAGSHGKTTTSTLIATLLAAVDRDPTAVIGGVVPAFGSNARSGRGDLLVAEADESDGSLVKFHPSLGLITNLELDHTDHYPDLESLVATMRRFAGNCRTVLANRDCAVLRESLRAQHWWSIEPAVTDDGPTAQFRAIPVAMDGAGTTADYIEEGVPMGRFQLPMAGRHNLSNALGAIAACRLMGIPFADLSQALADLEPPGRRFDCRGEWQGRLVVDDYAHHPSEVEATMAMARLMVESGRSSLPWVPQRVVAVFQPHRYSRTADFMERFAQSLTGADTVLLAPLYSAGEAPIAGVSSEALATRLRELHGSVEVSATLEDLAEVAARNSREGDLLLVMGAGDVNRLWDLLARTPSPAAS